MELSHEDSLRLNVLLSQELHAVRIDESAMVLHALTGRGDAEVALNPNCRDDLYLRRIRELLSTHVLGSPGGYPVFLKRWTRMGQMRDESLHSLLILGEPEAVVAVAHAQGLTEELARSAWWAMPTAEVARKMLSNNTIAQSALGKELASFLIEFLPFEAEPHDLVESVRLVLQPGLIDATVREGLWKKGMRKSAYYVGFLYGAPDELPEQKTAHPLWQKNNKSLHEVCAAHNTFALQLLRVLSAPGQSYLSTVENAMEKVANQEVVVALLQALNNYFSQAWSSDDNAKQCLHHRNTVAQIDRYAEELINDSLVQQVLKISPALRPQIEALIKLSLVGEPLVNPIFAQTDAIGSVMRKKVQPVTDWLQVNISLLKA